MHAALGPLLEELWRQRLSHARRVRVQLARKRQARVARKWWKERVADMELEQEATQLCAQRIEVNRRGNEGRSSAATAALAHCGSVRRRAELKTEALQDL